MTKVDISKNRLYAAGTKLLAEALKGNQIITELDISSNNATWDGERHGEMSGVIALADVIPGMGALLKLDISSNSIPENKMEGPECTCAAGSIQLSV
jgi:hypothetical protein